MKEYRFGLVGAAGYIAPRHMLAIKNNGGHLVAALDPNDSVGQMDRYFPEALFFNNFERFERYIYKMRTDNQALDYLSICSPNYLHDTHCRFALVNDMHAICEKPLVLNPWNLDSLQKAEQETGYSIFNILQLRLHPEVIKLKESLESNPSNKRHSVVLDYITPRGPWYHISWKGQEEKSGGIASNIGVHFFDMLIWLFGSVEEVHVYENQKSYTGGRLILENADVEWFLSVDRQHLSHFDKGGKATYRALSIDGKDIEFSEGFERLHDISYARILSNEGFKTSDVRPVIELIHQLRHRKTNLDGIPGHRMLNKIRRSDV